MKRFRALWRRLLGTLPGESRDNDLAAEIEEHLQAQTDDNVRLGMPPQEARRAAVLKFGGVESTKEQYRDQRGIPQLETILQDLRFALRSCASRPAFLSVVVLSLAIGIGLNTTLFAWLKAVYLNPLPGVTDARHLVTINAGYKRGAGYSNGYNDYTYIRDHSHLFSGIFAHEMEMLALNDGKSAELTRGGIVTGNYFEVLNTRIAQGRRFRPDEDQVLDRDAVVVLGDGLWRTRFAADPAILGRKIALNRIPFTVIGIAAPGFAGVYGGLRQNFWIPLHMARMLDANHRDTLSQGRWLQIMGRPKAGVPVSAIQSELDVLTAQMGPLNHKNEPDYRALAYPLHEAQRGFHSSLFQLVKVLAIAVAIILLLACLNAANLLIGRAAARSREISVRISLGAGRSRIVRQLLTESFLIAVLAGLVGLIIMDALRSLPALLSPPGMELTLNLGVDWTVIAFLFAVTTATSILFGLLPALETAKVDIVDSLKEGSGSITGGRRRMLWRRSLVVGQVALTITALFCAALFTAYLSRVMNVDRGFQSKNILTAEADLQAAGLNETRGKLFYRESLERLQALPGVQSAAWTTFLPMNFSGGGNTRPVEVRGYSAPSGNPLPIVVDSVSPGYLKTLGIPVVNGREFEWSDTAASLPVLLVNQEFVNQYLGHQDPIGAQVQLGGTWHTIVGVHKNYVYRDPTQSADPAILLPITQDYHTSAIVVIRAASDPAPLLSSLRRITGEFDPNIPVSHVMTMEENVGFHFIENKVGTVALAFFATVACILSAIGIYAVLATFVSQRRREFGIRIALGAMPRDVRKKVLAESALMAGIGSFLGLGLCALAAQLLKTELLDLTPFDPRLYAAAALVMSLTTLLSTLAPAHSVSNLDPVTALRSE